MPRPTTKTALKPKMKISKHILPSIILPWLGLPSMAPAQTLDEIAASLVTVRALSGNRVEGVRAGVLADESGYVVTSAYPLTDAETVGVRIGTETTERAAEIRFADLRSGIAVVKILDVDGALPAATFSEEEVDVSFLLSVPSSTADPGVYSLREGSVSRRRDLDPPEPGDRAVRVFEHNALVAAGDFGMPALDSCGNVIGIVRPDPDLSRSRVRRGEDPEAVVFTTAAPEVLAALRAAGGDPAVAAERCVGALERARTEAERSSRNEEEARAAAASAQEDREAAEARAQSAEERAQELEREASAARERADASEEEKARAAAEAEAARAAADAERERAENLAAVEAEVREELERIRESRRELEEDVARERLYVGIAITVLAVIVGIASFVTGRRRKLRLSQAAARAELAERAAAQAKTDAERARAPFSCLFEGRDSVGRSVTIKVSAELLGQEDGAVVGRHPESADVVLDHEEVSRRHFRLMLGDDRKRLFVQDLGSTNGTIVSGRPARGNVLVEIEDGDELAIGTVISMKLSLLDP